ncbi:MAG: head-tail adaptor protein [Mycobacteriaceae bacterium]|nr:head-tail adaptor protein [Mycobacteriaceae bacterium]
MKAMAIGQLRQRVDVANPSRSADGQGGYTDSWAAASPSAMWASIEPATASVVERIVGNTIEAPISHVITMRYHAGVTTQTRLAQGGTYYAVRGVQDVDLMHEWLVLACEVFP